MAKERPILAKGQHLVTRNAALYILHTASFSLYAYTFFWHFGSEAAKLPQSQGFGSFTQYLTSCTFFFHTFTLMISVLSHRLPDVKALRRLEDDLSCAVFSITHVCNFMYWLKFILTLPPSPSAPGVQPFVLVTPPLWLVLTLHAMSSVIAALDLLLAHRSFSKTSWKITRAYCGSYVVWIHICSWVNKRYPYPFMNALPQPQSALLISVVAYTAISLSFRLGAGLANSESAKLKHQ